MLIYMIHQQHGAMHVYSEAEAVANEKSGWKRAEWPPVSKEKPAPKAEIAPKAEPEATPPAPPDISQQREGYIPVRRGPGRPRFTDSKDNKAI